MAGPKFICREFINRSDAATIGAGAETSRAECSFVVRRMKLGESSCDKEPERERSAG